jgi:glycopeptide antibiotics resistance protein
MKDPGKIERPGREHSLPGVDPDTRGHAPEGQRPDEERSSAAISDEPLINAFHRMVIEIVFVAYAAALAYVSFVPFDFTRHPHQVSGSREFLGLALASFSIHDILANIAVYIPFGALGFAVLRRRRLGCLVSALLAIVVGGLLSFTVEWGQRWVTSRVSSWVDVSANILGSGLGITLVAVSEGRIRRMAERARWAARRNWWLTLSKASVCAVLVLQLRPYDVVVDPFRTAAALRHADVSPLARWHAIPAEVSVQIQSGRLRGLHALERVQWEYCLDRTVDMAVYASVVALIILGMSPHFRNRFLLFLWAGFIGTSLAMMVTGIRVFLISHGLDTAHFLCGVLGWPIGCLLGSVVLRSIAKARVRADAIEHDGPRASSNSESGARGAQASHDPRGTQQEVQGSRSNREPATRQGMPAWQKLVIVFALVFVAAYELAPLDIVLDFKDGWPKAAHGVVWLPFGAHFHSRPNVAFYDISGNFLRFGVVGICLAMIAAQSPSRPWRRQLVAIVLATGALCFVLEGLHVFMPTHHADTTTLVLAMSGAFAGTVALRWVADYRKSLPVFVSDDLLTAQLIEGETYKGLPTINEQASAKKTMLPR